MELVESKASERRPQWRLRLPTPLLRGLELTPLCTQPTSQAHRFFGGFFFNGWATGVYPVCHAFLHSFLWWRIKPAGRRPLNEGSFLVGKLAS